MKRKEKGSSTITVMMRRMNILTEQSFIVSIKKGIKAKRRMESRWRIMRQ